MAVQLTSSAFKEGEGIPHEYTCEGQDVSPPLRWNSPPPRTRSFALIADDPDAPVGTWVHWALFNVPADERELPEGVPTEEALPKGAHQGLNDFRRVGYGGPCPLPGKPHRYFFKLYALDTTLNLPARDTKAQVLKASKGHILGKAQLMGRFGR